MNLLSFLKISYLREGKMHANRFVIFKYCLDMTSPVRNRDLFIRHDAVSRARTFACSKL